MAYSNDFQEIQEELLEYFKDTDDKTLRSLIDCLAFHKGTSDANISNLAEKFLDDIGIREAYTNYLMELAKPSSIFVGHPVDVQTVEEIKKALLVIGYLRFSKSAVAPKPTQLAKLSKSERVDLTKAIEHLQRDNDDLLDDEDRTREMFDKEEAEELIAERKRFGKLYTKVLNLLK